MGPFKYNLGSSSASNRLASVPFHQGYSTTSQRSIKKPPPIPPPPTAIATFGNRLLSRSKSLTDLRKASRQARCDSEPKSIGHPVLIKHTSHTTTPTPCGSPHSTANLVLDVIKRNHQEAQRPPVQSKSPAVASTSLPVGVDFTLPPISDLADRPSTPHPGREFRRSQLRKDTFVPPPLPSTSRKAKGMSRAIRGSSDPRRQCTILVDEEPGIPHHVTCADELAPHPLDPSHRNYSSVLGTKDSHKSVYLGGQTFRILSLEAMEPVPALDPSRGSSTGSSKGSPRSRRKPIPDWYHDAELYYERFPKRSSPKSESNSAASSVAASPTTPTATFPPVFLGLDRNYTPVNLHHPRPIKVHHNDYPDPIPRPGAKSISGAAKIALKIGSKKWLSSSPTRRMTTVGLGP